MRHYQNALETGSDISTENALSFGGTGPVKCRITTIVAVCAVSYAAIAEMRYFCLSSLKSCPSKRSQLPTRFGNDQLHISVKWSLEYLIVFPLLYFVQ